MDFKTQVDTVTEKMLEEKNYNKISIAWFWIEIAVMTLFVMVAIIQFWKYTNIVMASKFFITIMVGLVIYDIYRTFVYVRYVFIKTK